MIQFLSPPCHFRNFRISANAFWTGLLAMTGLLISVDVSAQSADITGIARITNWPESRSTRDSGHPPAALDYTSYNLLPFVDTLDVRYRFSEASGFPSMHFVIEWKQGSAGILAGRQVEAADLPRGIFIESIDLVIPVMARGSQVAEFFLPLDTINLGPSPSMTFVDVTDASWDSVFVDVDEKSTRAIFDSGFRLGAPRIVRVVFAVADDESDARTGLRDGPGFPRSAPVDRTVCIPDLDVWISWSGGRSRWTPPRGTVTKATRDRRGEMGRTGLVDRTRVDRGYDRGTSTNPDASAPGRSGQDGAPADEAATPSDEEAKPSDAETTPSENESGKSRDRAAGRSGGAGIGDLVKPKKTDDDDDDDDDDRLYPAALAGIAAIGGVAIFGGTIGYFGSMSKAPIGLMAGYVERDGGVLLQVAINRQVFGKASGPENLIAGVTGFFDAMNSPLQPALGLGVRITEEDSETVAWKPSISPGLVGNFGRVVALAGYDVITEDLRFGIAFNFRFVE